MRGAGAPAVPVEMMSDHFHVSRSSTRTLLSHPNSFITQPPTVHSSRPITAPTVHTGTLVSKRRARASLWSSARRSVSSAARRRALTAIWSTSDGGISTSSSASAARASSPTPVVLRVVRSSHTRPPLVPIELHSHGDRERSSLWTFRSDESSASDRSPPNTNIASAALSSQATAPRRAVGWACGSSAAAPTGGVPPLAAVEIEHGHVAAQRLLVVVHAAVRASDHDQQAAPRQNAPRGRAAR